MFFLEYVEITLKVTISPMQSNDGINKYGWSKLGGECAVHILDNYLILRACLCDYPFLIHQL